MPGSENSIVARRDRFIFRCLVKKYGGNILYNIKKLRSQLVEFLLPEMHKITKLVLPVAGLGKRLRPLTLRTPKALIKLKGRPLLDYVLGEVAETDIREVILVVGPTQKKRFLAYLKTARKRFPGLKFYILVQDEPLGTGHVLLMAEDLIKDDYFAVRFCDDLLVNETPFFRSLINEAEKLEGSLLTLRKVPRSQVSRFGVVEAKHIKGIKNIFTISKIIEKPEIKKAPSNLVLIGAYVLAPSIMRQLKMMNRRLKKGRVNDSLLLTTAFDMDLVDKNKIFGLEFKGKYLDCGTLESLKAASEALSPAGNKIS